MDKTEIETLKIEEAARILGIGRQKAYELARSGELTVLRFGKRMVVPKIALQRLIERAEMDN